MSVDQWAVALIITAGIGYTLFTLAFALTVKWWRSLAAAALMVSSLSLTLLIDISLLYQVLGDDYPLRDAVRLSVFALIAAGGWLKLVALLWSKFTRRAAADDRFDRGAAA